MPPGAWYGRAFGALSALVPALCMWGFTVDDALIPLRYTAHLAAGAGYRFNIGGAISDGVTPLPWAPMLVALGGSLLAAKVFGLVVWTIAGGVLGEAVVKKRAGSLGLLVLALAFPVGAWAVSGMETAVATALATLAAVSVARPTRAAALAGLAAVFRPELVVWSLVIARRRAWLAAIPFALVVAVRLAVFGRPAPLALLAKPSDLSHGLAYGLASTLAVLTPILCLAPRALLRAGRPAQTIVLAAIAHVLVVIAVGGDWMPYSRLLVPITPSLVLAFVDIADVSLRALNIARSLAATALGIALAVTNAPRGRHVQRDRAALITAARPALAASKVVAALDVGWVGAASDATIVDLAGLTDETIATLPGGHTSKAVDVAMLLDRNVDTVLVYSAPRLVEERLIRSPLFAERFAFERDLALGTAHYALYRAR